MVTLNEIVHGIFCSAYLGYYAMAGCGGRGLMTRAVELAVGHAFDELGLHRVESNIQPGNHRSRALVKRLGFRLEGYVATLSLHIRRVARPRALGEAGRRGGGAWGMTLSK